MPKAVVEVGAEMEAREVTVDPAEKAGKAEMGLMEETQILGRTEVRKRMTSHMNCDESAILSH